MEIGSFIELELKKGLEIYSGNQNIARLNTGRAAIWHSVRVLGADTVWIPYYQCESVREFLKKRGCGIKYYHIDKDFSPIDIEATDDEAVLLVNYFGIMSRERMQELASNFKNVIIDNSQAFFCTPLPGCMNVYSARKFLGVADGAYVIGENAHRFVDEYPQGFSSDTAVFLLTRIEYGCEGKGYETRNINEARIESEDVMRMSKLTHAMLDGADYEYNKRKRRENFKEACRLFDDINKINPGKFYDEDVVPMVYPLVVENDDLLGCLLKAKHFQGHWWKYITEELPEETFEHWMSRYVIPVTIDQRYGKEELRFIRSIIDKAGI